MITLPALRVLGHILLGTREGAIYLGALNFCAVHLGVQRLWPLVDRQDMLDAQVWRQNVLLCITCITYFAQVTGRVLQAAFHEFSDG